MVRYGQPLAQILDRNLIVGEVVDVAESVDITKLTPGKRVTLLSDSYRLEKMLPSSVGYLSFSRTKLRD